MVNVEREPSDPRLTEEQRAALRPYITSGFLAAMENLAKRMTAPFYWYDTVKPRGEQILGGGTMCFVHTGRRLLGITAAHIHRTCVKAREEIDSLACQVGGHSFDPERCVIEVDDDLDLATYALSEIQVNAALADYHSAPEWPPRVNPAVPFMPCGWPWSLAQNRDRSTDHFFVHFIAKLNDSTARNLVIVISPSTSIPWKAQSLVPGTNIGGMSGGPVYQINERSLSVLTLVGIIYEYSRTMEYVRARPLSLVDSGGRFLG